MQPEDRLAPALERLRRGDLAGARAALAAALETAPQERALHELAGFVATRMGDPSGAIPHFRALLAQAPADVATRCNLASALIATGDLDGALEACAPAEEDARLLRLAAHVHQQQGRFSAAAQAYESVVAAWPDDFESWNNLGNARRETGDIDAAIDALHRAINLRRDAVPIYVNLSQALAAASRTEDRAQVMREAVRLAPDDAEVQTELGLAEAGLRNFDAAERAYRAAIAIDPGGALAAYLELGVQLETLNRVDDLESLIAAAERHGIAVDEINFLKAWAARRRGRIEEALALAESTPETIIPVRRAHLLADLLERQGRTDEAFAHYERVNRSALALWPTYDGPTYRARVSANAALMTPSRVASWRTIEVDSDPPSPVFIVGFPRSGTTLLDTLLMNMPQFHVMEELQVLHDVDIGREGGDAALATMTAAEANALRAAYFAGQRQISPSAPGQTIVDKHPLQMTRMPLIHRLFPDARIVLVERHPCDAVLSCFMANFQLNVAMRSFTDLEEAARTYDAVFDAWTRAEALLPLRVHRIRYERMVENLEDEMRPLLDFLGAPWDPAVLDNQKSAAARGHVRTASYSQVTEPIYTRALARWERYRRHLEPVLPILAPWAERMGYEI